MTFQGDSGVTPDNATNLVDGKLVGSRALSNTIPGSLKPDPRDPDTETGNLETEKRVHRIHGTLETGLHKDAPQPGGPLKGGRRIYVCMYNISRESTNFTNYGHLDKDVCRKCAGSVR